MLNILIGRDDIFIIGRHKILPSVDNNTHILAIGYDEQANMISSIHAIDTFKDENERVISVGSVDLCIPSGDITSTYFELGDNPIVKNIAKLDSDYNIIEL